MTDTAAMRDDAAAGALRREAERGLHRLRDGAGLRALLERRGDFDRRTWAHCRAQGWCGIGIPETHGGVGLGLAEMGVLAQVAGALPIGVPLLESGFAAAQAIGRHGDAAIRAEWLPLLARGEAGGLLSIAEEGEALPARPALRWQDGRLRGSRRCVPAAACADLAVLSADSTTGPVLVLADLRAAWVFRDPVDSFDNSRCVADLRFDGAAAVRLGALEPDRGWFLLGLQATVAAHQQLGGARRLLEMARTHALDRIAFGQPIGAFQSVKHRIAEIYVLVELAAAAAEAAVAAAEDGGDRFALAAISARLLGSEAYETAARDAAHLHGGIGATWDSDLHLHQRRARALALELGSILSWEDGLVDLLAREAATEPGLQAIGTAGAASVELTA